MTRKNWDEIETSLRENVETARAAYIVARENLDKAIIPFRHSTSRWGVEHQEFRIGAHDGVGGL